MVHQLADPFMIHDEEDLKKNILSIPSQDSQAPFLFQDAHSPPTQPRV